MIPGFLAAPFLLFKKNAVKVTEKNNADSKDRWDEIS